MGVSEEDDDDEGRVGCLGGEGEKLGRVCWRRGCDHVRIRDTYLHVGRYREREWKEEIAR